MSGLEPSYENIIKQELQIADLKRAYHALMGQAVRFAEWLRCELDGEQDESQVAKEFLTSPEVRAWREQEGL